MSKSKKDSKKCKVPQDVTVYDFANSTVCNNRLKKSTASVSFVVKKELEVRDNWYDDDDDDNEIEITPSNNNFRRSRKHGNGSSVKQDIQDGNEYPYDVWFLISNYIRPEDVGRFAGICKTSYEVVKSMQFWISLYKRHYTCSCMLPEEFHPRCLLRYFALRTSVIRALFYMYPAFIARTRTSMSITHPDIFIGKKCVGLAGRMEDKQWCYYFKFKLNKSTPLYINKGKSNNIIELLNDIQANPDEGLCMLKVISKEATPVPPVIGYILKYVSLSLSKGFRSHRLQLMFGSEIQNYSRTSPPGSTVVIDPICKIQILNWWDPTYITEKLWHFVPEDSD